MIRVCRCRKALHQVMPARRDRRGQGQGSGTLSMTPHALSVCQSYTAQAARIAVLRQSFGRVGGSSGGLGIGRSAFAGASFNAGFRRRRRNA